MVFLCEFAKSLLKCTCISLLSNTFNLATRLRHLPMYSGHSEYICWHSLYPVHLCTIWGHWNFRLFVMPHTSQHTQDLPNLSDDCDLWNHPVFWLLLAPTNQRSKCKIATRRHTHTKTKPILRLGAFGPSNKTTNNRFVLIVHSIKNFCPFSLNIFIKYFI